MNNAWDDPAVTEALKRRTPEDVYLFACLHCGAYSYYNPGSHFFACAWCPWTTSGGQLDLLLDADDPITLAYYTERQIIEETEADA